MSQKYFSISIIIFLFVICGLIWSSLFYFTARQKMLVTFFDIGQGDSIFIEVPGGNQVLIDGGPDEKILAKLGSYMPFWDHSIDLLILTHPHADHLDGLFEVVKRYDIGTVIESAVSYTTPEYKLWHELLEKKKINIVVAKAGEHVSLGNSATIDILTPFDSFAGKSMKNVHDAMVVSRLTYGEQKVLLAGDAEKLLEYKLIQASRDLPFFNLRADVLKAGHHGSKTSSTEEFIHVVSPRATVISVGRKNRYGHPHQEIIDRFINFGIPIFRTDEKGDITLQSNGRKIGIMTSN